jgi:ferredoxin
MPMRIQVDRELCQGHARCYALAPELFELDDIGHAFERRSEVPIELEDKARQATQSCPERAISFD